MTVNSDDGKLDACGCCEGIEPRKARYNRPGLQSIDYRLDTHSGFFRRALSKLHLQEARNRSQPLRDLTTRSRDDPAIAFLDAWALVADVLTFYQERAANEGFLRTLRERRSAVELARAIGYELKPGVAAGVHLAFTMDDSPGSPKTAVVPRGLAVKSIPPPGKLPQTFETSEEIEARVEWNSLLPQLTEEQRVGDGSTEILLEGLDTFLQPGDAILLIKEESSGIAWQMRILTTVKPDHEGGFTLVGWDDPLTDLGDPEDEFFANPRVFAMRERPDLDRYVPEGPSKTTIDLEGTYPRILPGSWVVMTLDEDLHEESLYKVESVYLMTEERTVKVVVPPSTGCPSPPPLEFTSDFKITRIKPGGGGDLSQFSDLETAIFAQSEPLSLAAKVRGGLIEGDAIELKRAVYGFTSGKILIASGKLMRARIEADGLSLVSSRGVENDLIRDDSLQVLKPPQTVELLWTLEDGDSVGTVVADVGDIIFEANPDSNDEEAWALVMVDGLKISKKGDERELFKGEVLRVSDPPKEFELIWTLRDGDGFEGSVTALAGEITLQSSQAEDSMTSEVVTLEGTTRFQGKTLLLLKKSMEGCYDPATFAVRANVSRATHGETGEEVMGSGDGSKSNQRFELGKPDLTYISAPTSSGTKSTLEVRVNGILWKELPSLYAASERSYSYVVRIDDDALATVIFGDGKSGARLPTGDENVATTYRSGIGPDGEVAAESLTILQSRPLGISEVTNPLPASGAAPPEKLSDARHNAPLTVLTLDRIVSLRDFEHFVRSFAGIGKAQAVSIPRRQSKVVHITIGSSSGKEVDRGSQLYRNLVKAIDAMRDPVARVRERIFVDSFKLQTFSLKAGLLIDPRLVAEEVLARAKAELRRIFSFENRAFGQFVTVAEVMAVIQTVEGVIAVDLDRLERDDGPKAATSLKTVLVAERARIDEESGAIFPAELLLLNPADEGAVLEELRS